MRCHWYTIAQVVKINSNSNNSLVVFVPSPENEKAEVVVVVENTFVDVAGDTEPNTAGVEVAVGTAEPNRLGVAPAPVLPGAEVATGAATPKTFGVDKVDAGVADFPKMLEVGVGAVKTLDVEVDAPNKPNVDVGVPNILAVGVGAVKTFDVVAGAPNIPEVGVLPPKILCVGVGAPKGLAAGAPKMLGAGVAVGLLTPKTLRGVANRAEFEVSWAGCLGGETAVNVPGTEQVNK